MLKYLAAGVAASALLASMPAHASLIADGITYTLTEAALTPTEEQLTLNITGINAASDTEKGRAAVQSFALTQPANFSSAAFVSATPVQGFNKQVGGLNSSGCNGSGNFYCFASTTTPPSTPSLAAGSTISFAFDVFAAAGSFIGYTPDLKINWVGSKNNYDLVSKSISAQPVTGVPEPASLTVLGAGLLGLALSGRKKLDAVKSGSAPLAG
jgi:PEP-CTERM motif